MLIRAMPHDYLCRTDKQLSEKKHEWTAKYAFHSIYTRHFYHFGSSMVMSIYYLFFCPFFLIERIGIKCTGITCVITTATKNHTVSLVTTSWTPRQVNLIKATNAKEKVSENNNSGLN